MKTKTLKKFHLDKIFSPNEVNIGRQYAIDVAKFVCICGMVLIHSISTTMPVYNSTMDLNFLVIFVSVAFGPGTYMFCMGMGVAYSRNNNPKYHVIRGLILIAIAYALSFIRYPLPYLLLQNNTYVYTQNWYIDFFDADILHFAGLFFLSYALFKKIKLKDWMVFIIAIALALIGWYFRNLNFYDLILNHFVGLFLGTFNPDIFSSTRSYFPYCNWFIVPVCGLFFGKALKHCKNLKRFYLLILPIAAILFFTYSAISVPLNFDLFDIYDNFCYHRSLLATFMAMSCTLVVFSSYHLFFSWFPPFIKSFITKISKNILFFYLVHLILIKWVWIFLYRANGAASLKFNESIFFAMFMLVFMMLLTCLFDYIKTCIKEKKIPLKDKIQQIRK